MMVRSPSEMVRAALVLQTSFTARGLYRKTLKKPRRVRPSEAAGGPAAPGLTGGVASREPALPTRALISRCGGFVIGSHTWGRRPQLPSDWAKSGRDGSQGRRPGD